MFPTHWEREGNGHQVVSGAIVQYVKPREDKSEFGGVFWAEVNAVETVADAPFHHINGPQGEGNEHNFA